MTEEEWLACVDPTPMLEFIRGTASERKVRLFACGCCRENWHLLREYAGHREIIETLEEVVDGVANQEDLELVLNRAENPISTFPVSRAVRDTCLPDPFVSARLVSYNAALGGSLPSAFPFRRQGHTDLVRDIFGNPFRPVALAPGWRTDIAVALARQMYESRDFSDMPILADALQDAGCDSDEVLTHCRGSGPHVRGCWVVDLVLGKK